MTFSAPEGCSSSCVGKLFCTEQDSRQVWPGVILVLSEQALTSVSIEASVAADAPAPPLGALLREGADERVKVLRQAGALAETVALVHEGEDARLGLHAAVQT